MHQGVIRDMEQQRAKKERQLRQKAEAQRVAEEKAAAEADALEPACAEDEVSQHGDTEVCLG